MLSLPDPNDELDRPLNLEGGIDLLAPRFLLSAYDMGVVCHPRSVARRSTLANGPGLKQSLDAAIGTRNQQEASATLELPPGDLDRGSSKGWSQSLLPGEGGVPDRPSER
jgi:hypothetical protein